MEAANKVIASQRKPSSGRRLSDKVQRAVATTEEDLGRQFHCVGSSVFNSTVPLSRVGDGAILINRNIHCNTTEFHS